MKTDIFDDLILPTDEEIKRETTKKRISNSLKGKTLEQLVGKEKAIAGKESRRQANYKQDYSDRGKKIAATRKAQGSYGTSMLGKTHKESTKELQAQKAKIRQEIKRKLGLGRNDIVPKDLLEKAYKKLTKKIS